jgi:hypothetical protein
MESLKTRLQKRIHVSVYTLLTFTTLFGISFLTESCADKKMSFQEQPILITYLENTKEICQRYIDQLVAWHR